MQVFVSLLLFVVHIAMCYITWSWKLHWANIDMKEHTYIHIYLEVFLQMEGIQYICHVQHMKERLAGLSGVSIWKGLC
jgi:DNA-binding phage protein